jgi:hypothetical protein
MLIRNQTWLCMALLASLLPADAAAIDLEAMDWQARCERIRAELEGGAGAQAVYQDLPATAPRAASWPVVLFDVLTPIPPAAYTEVLAHRGEDGSISLMILSDGGPLVSLLDVPRTEPMDDVFATIDFSGAVDSSTETQNWTHEIFGGPVSLEHVIDLGFHHQPSELTCSPDAWESEIPMSIALTVTSIFNAGEVYRLPGGEGLGWVTRSPDGTRWSLNSVGEERVRSIDMFFPEPGGNALLGLGFGHGALQVAPDQPTWLSVVSRLSGDLENTTLWNDLADQLEAAGLSERSVQSARQMAAGE